MTDFDCDAVVIGSGPGGATVAEVLTAAGWSVVMLEKGRNHLIDTTAPFAFRYHFANDEIAASRRHLLGPDPLLEPRVYRDTVGEVNNLPSTVGGGGIHADAKLPRFREEDFALASVRGPIDDATVKDWPFGYDEMEPHYAAVEKSFGVAGEETNPFAAPRRDPFPMPPGPDMPFALVSGAAAERLGLHPYRAPTGANSVDYDGRPACVDCGYCGGYGCPIHAKGDPISSLQRSLTTGLLDLRAEAYVSEIVLSADRRRATGVRYLDLTSYPDPPTVEVRAARAVIVAGGAFETPRLLLRCGLGGDAVGRYLTYHYQTFTVGIFDRDTGGERGRAVTHLHDDLMIDTPEMRKVAADAGLPWVRGGTTEHGAGQHPVGEALSYGRGEAHLPSMQDSSLRRRLWVFTVQGEDLPQSSNRVELDTTVRDAWGFPAGQVTYVPHRHELAASAYAADLHERVMKDAGATAAFSATSPRNDEPPESRHVMGTARMGTDPSTSVVSPAQHLWDVDNVFVCDSSVFVTSSGYNPTLTLAALAHRRYVASPMSDVMRAAVLGGGPGKLAVEDVPVPTVGDGDVLVEVDLCGICGSDLHMVLDGWGPKGSWEGHEWVGRVAAIGPSVTRWRVGDIVVGGPSVRCGECDACRAGRPSLCAARDTPGATPDQGAFATYKVTKETEVLPKPEGLDLRAAALAEPLAVALHGIHQGKVEPGMSVMVMGAGPIGALTIAALRAMGVDGVTCSEPTPIRREIATAVGAARVIHPDELHVPSIAEPGLVVEGAVDVVLECSGHRRAMEAGLAQLKRAGTLVLVGAGMAQPKFDPNRILLNEVVITGSFTYDKDGFTRALDLLSSGKMPIDALLEPGTVPLDGLLDAMRGLASGEIAGKVLVKP